MATRQTVRKSHVQLPNRAKSQTLKLRAESLQRVRHSRFYRISRVSAIAAAEDTSFHVRKSLNLYVRDDLRNEGRKTYFQRVFVFARNRESQDPGTPEDSASTIHPETKEQRQEAYRMFFQNHIYEIEEACDKKKFIRAELSGLYVCMDEYSFLMIEGDQDMLSNFFTDLAAVHDELWLESKVFLVEDNIGEAYLNNLNYRHSHAINTNEKFPPSTITDTSLMGVQHFYLKEKSLKLVRTFAEQRKNDGRESTDMISFALPADPYNRLIPEIQRIELVLKAHKFYRNVKDFALHYTTIPAYQDEDALFWPIHDSYTPLDIFERSEFDVNLTFGDYNSKEQQSQKRHTENDYGEGRDTIVTRRSTVGDGQANK